MTKGPSAAKAERFTEFLRRLREAFHLIGETLNAVENEMTAIPFDPARWETDGRMYPPQRDSERGDTQPGVRRFRTRAHHTRIGSNGAIAITNLADAVLFTKPGADGREIER